MHSRACRAPRVMRAATCRPRIQRVGGPGQVHEDPPREPLPQGRVGRRRTVGNSPEGLVFWAKDRRITVRRGRREHW